MAGGSEDVTMGYNPRGICVVCGISYLRGKTNGHIGVSYTEKVLRKYPYMLGIMERIYVYVAGNY